MSGEAGGQAQAPLLHEGSSPPWQLMPAQGVPSGWAMPTQAPLALQASLWMQALLVVQTLPVPDCISLHKPVEPLHATSLHTPDGAGQVLGTPPVQMPFWQAVFSAHWSVAVHGVPLVLFCTAQLPFCGLQTPTVQGPVAEPLQSLVAAPEQVPALQLPAAVQPLPPHAPPVSGVDTQLPVATSQVGAEWHSCTTQLTGGSVLQTPVLQVLGLHLSPPQLTPSCKVIVQVDVPLQARSAHISDAQLKAVPTHTALALHVSVWVQMLPSLHAVPVLGTTVQVLVPLQLRVAHWSLVQVIAVPLQAPEPSQVSLKVHGSPSLQPTAPLNVLVQPPVPLHTTVSSHCVGAGQVYAAPELQAPPEQTSLAVQPLPSVHEAVLLACAQPVAGTQLSSVHGLLSLQLITEPG